MSTTGNMITNVDAITLTMHRGLVEPNPYKENNESSFFLRTLGDFDFMTISKVKSMREHLDIGNFFSTAQLQGNESQHNLFLIKIRTEEIFGHKNCDGACEQDRDLCEFYNKYEWKFPRKNSRETDLEDYFKKYQFLFVSLIHLKKHGKKDIERFVKDVIGKYYKEGRDDEGNEIVQCNAFYSVDCNDLVFFVRTKSHKKVVEIIRDLRLNDEVQYTYTVCGMYDVVKGKERRGLKKIAMGGAIKSIADFNIWYKKLGEKIEEQNEQFEVIKKFAEKLFDKGIVGEDSGTPSRVAHEFLCWIDELKRDNNSREKVLKWYHIRSGVDINTSLDSEGIKRILQDNFSNTAKVLGKWYAEMYLKAEAVNGVHKFTKTNINPRINAYRRTGSEDVILNIMDVEGGWFFRQLFEAEGSFEEEGSFYAKKQPPSGKKGSETEEEPLFARAFFRPRIHIDISSKDEKQEEQEEQDRLTPLGISPENRTTLFYRYNKLLTNKNEVRNKFIHERSDKALAEVLKACDHLNKDGFAPSVFDCINYIFELLLKKLESKLKKLKELFEENEEKQMEENRNRIYWKFNEDLQALTQGMMSFLNGALQSDRVFFQVPGFNAVLYDSPAKLLHFYTAFMDRVVRTLDPEANREDKGRQYRFLLTADIYQMISVDHLFDSFEERDRCLLQVKTPVDKLFKPERLLTDLCREVAHVAGSEIRMRKERYVFLRDMFKEYIIREWFKETVFVTTEEEKNAFNEWFEKLSIEEFDKYRKEKYGDIANSPGEYIYFSERVREILFKIHERLGSERRIIMSTLLELRKKSIESQGNAKSLWMDFQKAEKNFREYCSGERASKGIDKIIEVTQQSFAEYITFLLLEWCGKGKYATEMIIKNYVARHYKNDRGQTQSPLSERIMSVVRAASSHNGSKEKVGAYKFEDCYLFTQDYTGESNHKSGISPKDVDDYWESLLSLFEKDKSDSDCLPTSVIDLNVKYLIGCCKKFFETDRLTQENGYTLAEIYRAVTCEKEEKKNLETEENKKRAEDVESSVDTNDQKVLENQDNKEFVESTVESTVKSTVEIIEIARHQGMMENHEKKELSSTTYSQEGTGRQIKSEEEKSEEEEVEKDHKTRIRQQDLYKCIQCVLKVSESFALQR